MKFRALLIVVAGLALACSAPSQAADAASAGKDGGSGTSTAEVQPSAHALQLSRQMIAAGRVMDQFKTLMGAMLPQMIDGTIKNISGFRQEWRRPLIDAAQAASEDMMQDLLKDAEVIYARVFTEEEMQKIIEFYQSPAGQAVLNKSPTLVPLIAKGMPERGRAMSADMIARFCTSTPEACRDSIAKPRSSGA